MSATNQPTLFNKTKIVLIGLQLLATSVSGLAGTIVWNGASGTDTNWSNGNNWIGAAAPGGGDDAKFYDAGANSTMGQPNSLVDSLFPGQVGTLRLGNTNGLHTIVISPGSSLGITNGNLTEGTLTDVGAARNFTNTITGAGGTLYVSNSVANIAINQAGANGPNRANLNLSGLDNFFVSANRIGIGDGQFPGVAVNNKVGGNLMLAKTNIITLAYSDTLANYQTAGKNSAIILSRNSGNNPGVISILQLGINNTFNVDSMDFGMDKSANNSTSPHGVMAFNPIFAGLNPVANFYGAGGVGSRVTWWAIGDGNQSASSSNGGGGTNDFGLGTLNAFVNVMSLARDAASAGDSWVGPHKGVLIFTNGTVDVNTLIIGNQALETGTSTTPSLGIFNVGGAGALLKVNTVMTLGSTSLAVPGAKTEGILNITNGAVLANNVTVGAASVTNIVNLMNGTLVVSNTLATNASGLFVLNVSNSTIGLTVPANGSLKALAQTLNSVGATNFIQLDPNPVIFSTYPQQFPLIKYTTWNGSNTFGLTSVPAWAPGATLISNSVNKSLDLSLPMDPRPIFTAQPTPFTGLPGYGETTNFSVIISAGSVTPLGYQWYYVTNGVTNLLTDGFGPSGISTLTGSTTANLQVADAQEGDSGNYFVVVTNQFGTNTSGLALMLISTSAIPPTVTGPSTIIATNGITTAIANTVSGLPYPMLFWQFNGTNLADGPGPSGASTISGSSGSALTISNPQYPGDQGVYSLVASNSAGMTTNFTVLTVIVPPVITNQPASIVVTNTQSASFTVVAGGVPNPTYQWYKNSLANPISSVSNPTATNATFTISSVSPSDMATYFVVVRNAAGSVTSSNATLTVNSTMAATALVPANAAMGVCYDTPLYITFDQAPTLRASGKISIYNVNNSTTPVDTIDMSQGTLQGRTIAGETFANYPVIVTGKTAAIYPHLDLLTSNQTYYVTIDDGVFADSTGAYFTGVTANTWQFTTKAGGPANPANMVVAQDYSGDFATVQGALDSLPANNSSLAYINVKNGLYTEIVEFKKSNVVLRGQSRDGTIIGYANNSTLNANTHTRMAMKVNANNIAIDNLTVTNATAQDYSQAEAIMIESGAAQVVVNNCNVDSYQDTILANISTSKAYFNNSLIQGDVDFIWGGGNLFFTNCEIRFLIRAQNAAALGPNPSPGASDIFSNGFSFVNCALTTLAGANPNDIVGRTRSITNGNTALINCIISTNIGGWSSDALPVANYRNWYYGCTNDLGAAVTLSNGIALSVSDPNLALASSASAWLYGWTPALAPNIITQPTNESTSAGQAVSLVAGATGIPAPAYQWFKNGTNLPGATASTLNIASAQRSDGASYYVVASNGSGSVTSSVVTLTYVNTAPLAQNFSMGALVGTPSTVLVIGGKYAPTDADGDPLTITGVSSASNGSVTTDGSSVTYTPANGPGDTFTYTVSDGFGGSANGTVTVYTSTNVQGYNLLSMNSLNGTNVLVFAGIPTYNYALDMATNLQAPINWMPQVTNPAANNGLLVFTNVPALPQSFYRTRYVP